MALFCLAWSAACGVQDPRAAQVMAAYDLPITATGRCIWQQVELGSPIGLRGTLHFGDEHFPDFFAASDEADLPEAAQNRYLAVAFRRGERTAMVGMYGDLVEVSGRIVAGDLACRGNFSTEVLDAALLVDRVRPVRPGERLQER